MVTSSESLVPAIPTTAHRDEQTCRNFFLFEPICTAILLAMCSAVHVIRIHAIYEKSRAVLSGMGGLLAFQIVVTAICCGFYRCMSPLSCHKFPAPDPFVQPPLSRTDRDASQSPSTTGKASTGCPQLCCTPPPSFLLSTGLFNRSSLSQFRTGS